jgi:hypothetical protein
MAMFIPIISLGTTLAVSAGVIAQQTYAQNNLTKKINNVIDKTNIANSFDYNQNKQRETSLERVASDIKVIGKTSGENTQKLFNDTAVMGENVTNIKHNMTDINNGYANQFSILSTTQKTIQDGLNRNIGDISTLQTGFSGYGTQLKDLNTSLLAQNTSNNTNFASINNNLKTLNNDMNNFITSNNDKYTTLTNTTNSQLGNQWLALSNINKNVTGFNSVISDQTNKLTNYGNIITNLTSDVTGVNNDLGNVKKSMATTGNLSQLQTNFDNFASKIPTQYAPISSVTSFKATTDNLSSSLNTLQSQIAKINIVTTSNVSQADIDTINKTITDLKLTVDNVGGLVNVINTNYAKKSELVPVLADTLNNTANIGKLNTQFSNLNSVSSTYALKTDINSLNTQLAQSKTSVDQLSQMILQNDPKSNIAQIQAAIASLPNQSNITILQSGLSNLTSAVNTNQNVVTSNLAIYANQIAGLPSQSNFNALSQNVTNLNTLVNTTNVDNAKNITDIKTLTATSGTNLKAAQDSITQLQSGVNTLTSTVSGLNNTYATKTDLTNLNNTLTTQIKSMQGSTAITASQLGLTKTDKLQLGNKFLLSGTGDFADNTDWLRLTDANGKDYYGTFASSRLYSRDGANFNGDTSIDKATINNSTHTGPAIFKNATTFSGATNQFGNSWFPYTDNNTYIRPGAEGKNIFIGDAITGNVQIGNGTTPINLAGRVNTPNGISVTNPDPGVLVEKNYGTPDNRYGLGQFGNGTTRMYTAGSTAFPGANLNMGFAQRDGTFKDALRITQDSSGNPSTQITGNFSVNGSFNPGTLTPDALIVKNNVQAGNVNSIGSVVADSAQIKNAISSATYSASGQLTAGSINTAGSLMADSVQLKNNISVPANTGNNQFGNSHFPYSDGNTYIRPGTDGKDISIGDMWANNINIGKGTSQINAKGNVNIAGNLVVNGVPVKGGTPSLDNSIINGIKYSGNWTGYPDSRTDGAEIANDTTGSKQLMIVGNKSGGGDRRVGVWDTLNVNGTLNMGGNTYQTGGQYYTNDRHIKLRGDENHGLGFDSGVDGPNLYGFSGGKLSSSKNTAAQWDINGKFTIPKKLQLGNKWLLSSDGDSQANDDWLRLLSANGSKDYYGGLASQRIWTTAGQIGSDQRMKQNIRPISKRELNKIDQLKPSHYQLKSDSKTDKFGFVTQDVKPVYPHLVSDGPNNMQAMDYNGVIPLVVGNIQDLRKRINDKKMCIGDLCLTKDELRKIKQNLK